MLSRSVLLAILAALSVNAVPLNINLGAYSPALVVGDGEISFGGAQNAGELMSTLATGAQANAANGAAAQAQGQQAAAQPAAPAAEGEAAEAPAEAQVATEQTADGSPARSIRQGLDGRAPNMSKRDIIADLEAQLASEKVKRTFAEALQYAREAQRTQPKVELGSENAGVGIVVSAGVDVPANSAANGAGAGAEAKVKRSEEAPAEPKQGITLLAIAEI